MSEDAGVSEGGVTEGRMHSAGVLKSGEGVVTLRMDEEEERGPVRRSTVQRTAFENALPVRVS